MNALLVVKLYETVFYSMVHSLSASDDSKQSGETNLRKIFSVSLDGIIDCYAPQFTIRSFIERHSESADKIQLLFDARASHDRLTP